MPLAGSNMFRVGEIAERGNSQEIKLSSQCITSLAARRISALPESYERLNARWRRECSSIAGREPESGHHEC